jgi:hypothetical protein
MARSSFKAPARISAGKHETIMSPMWVQSAMPKVIGRRYEKSPASTASDLGSDCGSTYLQVRLAE